MPLYVPGPWIDIGGVYVSLKNTSRIVELIKTLQITSDSYGLKLGGGQDVSMIYNGSNLNIDASIVAPSDVYLTTGESKTLQISPGAWEEIFVPASAMQYVDRSDAELVEISSGVFGLRIIDRGTMSTTWVLPHSWAGDEECFFKVHWTTPTPNVDPADWSCTTFGEGFTDVGDVFSSTKTLYTADVEPTGVTVSYTHYVTTLDTFVMGRVHIRAGLFTTFTCRCRDTDCFVIGFTFLHRRNTLGSRTTRTK